MTAPDQLLAPTSLHPCLHLSSSERQASCFAHRAPSSLQAWTACWQSLTWRAPQWALACAQSPWSAALLPGRLPVPSALPRRCPTMQRAAPTPCWSRLTAHTSCGCTTATHASEWAPLRGQSSVAPCSRAWCFGERLLWVSQACWMLRCQRVRTFAGLALCGPLQQGLVSSAPTSTGCMTQPAGCPAASMWAPSERLSGQPSLALA